MDDHTQFLAAPPMSPPPLTQPNPSSKIQYTSYGLQNQYTPQSPLESPPFYSNPPSARPSSTQYHATAAEPYDPHPQSFTFEPAHVQPMHTSLSETAPPQFTSPFLPGPLSHSPPQHMQLGFVNLASHPHAQQHKLNAGHRTTTISPPPLTASSPSPRSAGSSHGLASIPSHTTTSTSGVDTNAHALGRGNGSGSGKPTLPQKLSSGPGLGNGPARSGARSPTYPHGSTARVHPSLLPPSLWMSPTNPAPGSRPGFAHNHQGLVQAQKRQPQPLPPPPPLSPPLQQQQQQQHDRQYGNQHQHQHQHQHPPSLSHEILSPSSSIATSMSLASTSLGFGGTRGRRDSSVLTPVMSTIDEDEHERERKRHLSIVPSSSFSNFPSGLDGLAADAQNGHHYHHQPPPLSAVSGVSASMFSDLLSEAGSGAGAGVGVGEEPSPEELQKDPLAIQMWRLYARTKANLPHAQRMENLTWRMVGMALRRKIQLEEQMQAQHRPLQRYPHSQMIQMKEEDDEHQVAPVNEVPERGRRAQKFGLSVAIPGPTAAPTITRVKAKLRVEGFEMPDNGDGDGYVF